MDVSSDPISAELGLRERKKARLRSRISETAVRLFRDRGYRNTTVERITAELEISAATFYNYFPSKDAVLGEVGQHALAALGRLLEAELAGSAPTEERLRQLLRRVSEGVERDKAVWRAIFATGALNSGTPPGQRASAETIFALLEEILSEGQRRDEITRALPADQLAQILQGVILKLCADWTFEFPKPHALAPRMDAALALFLKGASAEEARGAHEKGRES